MAQGDEETARSAYPRFSLEVTLIRLATLPETIPVEEALERLETLEKKLGGTAAPKATPAAEKPPPAGKAASETGLARRSEVAPPAGATAEPVDSSDTWKRFVAFVTKEKRMLAVHLEQVQLLSLAPGQMKLGVEEGHHLKYLQDGEQLSALKDFARRFFAAETAVALTGVPARNRQGGVAAENAHQPRAVEAASGDPVVQAALRAFPGSTVQTKKEQ